MTLKNTLQILAERLLTILPKETDPIDWEKTLCAQWMHDGHHTGHLRALRPRLDQTFDTLIGIEKQIQAFRSNIDLFMHDLPSNATLLWGSRGTGKSSMVRAALEAYHTRGLRVIEVNKHHLNDLPIIVDQIRSVSNQFIIYCDDLTFENGEREYAGLKTVLDGTLEEFGSNILIVCTSNRRHLVSEPCFENLQSKVVDSELHHSEAIEERISLSDRFGLRLSFYPFPQDIYLQIVQHWYTAFGQNIKLPPFTSDVAKEADSFAISRGGRGGRVARQFVIDWMARKFSENSSRK